MAKAKSTKEEKKEENKNTIQKKTTKSEAKKTPSKKTSTTKNANKKKTNTTKTVDTKKKTATSNSNKKVATKKNKDAKKEETKKQENIEEQLEENLVEENLPTLEPDKIAEIGKQIKKERKLPEEKVRNVRKEVFHNLLLSGLILIYSVMLYMGFYNIPESEYIVDLKVFSIAGLVISILLFEKAYKKDKGSYWIHGIEISVLALITLGYITIMNLYKGQYGNITIYVGLAYFVYYIFKSVIYNIYSRRKVRKEEGKKKIKKEEKKD